MALYSLGLLQLAVCLLQEFLAAEGKQLEDGSRDDPTLDRFEAEIGKYRAVQEEIQALPTSATIGYIKIDAKPIKQALTTWVTKWIYLFTHYLQIKVGPFTLPTRTATSAHQF